jgi:putative FmdB family regulatory protein
MPKYVYSCSQCEQEFEVRHGMKEVLNLCVYCGEKDSIQRIPQLTNIIQKDAVGQKVKEAIEENRKVLKSMKKDAKRSHYE